jgi:predicted alpha-1,2-mannosidase
MSRYIIVLLLASNLSFADIKFIDPFIGTSGRLWAASMLSPSANTPFGMIKLGPDTKVGRLVPNIIGNKLSTSGYHSKHKRILGFSHTRLQGTGAEVGGNFRILPFTRKKLLKKPQLGTQFKNKNEMAKAGYYRVDLHREGVIAELTASPRCAFTKVNFKKYRGYISIDSTSNMNHKIPQVDAMINMIDDTRFQATATQDDNFASRYDGLKAYLYGAITPRPSSINYRDNNKRIIFEFENTKEVLLRTCLSYVSFDNAKLNFDAEAKNIGFMAALKRAENSWKERLKHIKIEAPLKVKRQFYTALFHTMQMPTLYTDVNGEYLGFQKTVGLAKDFTYYSDLSLWDTFRTTHPVYTLFFQDMQLNSVKSLLAMADIHGQFPRWAQGGGEAGSMFGSPANFLIGETYLKEIGDFDIEKALSYMVKATVIPTPGVPNRERVCLDYGYCPQDKVRRSVSKTLEYAWSDHIVHLVANELGHEDISQEFLMYSKLYKNLWDRNTLFFRAKTSAGVWRKLKPNWLYYFNFLGRPSEPYSEGTARNYRYTVPHDGKELVKLFGGSEPFIKNLNNFISRASKRMGALNPTAFYWHGNQHNLHAIYMFNEASAPQYTQKWVRWALTQRYDTKRIGYDGNDDGGTLSGWYVLSSLGLYPQAGTNKYWLGAPIIEKATLKIGEADFVITAKNQSPENMFVEAVYLNGKQVCSPVLTHQELQGELIFHMTDSPQLKGGYDCETI